MLAECGATVSIVTLYVSVTILWLYYSIVTLYVGVTILSHVFWYGTEYYKPCSDKDEEFTGKEGENVEKITYKTDQEGITVSVVNCDLIATLIQHCSCSPCVIQWWFIK